MASNANLIAGITLQAQKALTFPRNHAAPDFELTVRDGGTLPLSIEQTKFKKIDLLVNQGQLLVKSVSSLRPANEQALKNVIGQLVYSVVRLWAGHFMYCPCDQSRHEQLCRAAEAAFDAAADEILSTPPNKLLAELIAAFFERSIVANINAEAEGEQFTKGVVYEHIINSHPSSLLTTLFFKSQIRVAPITWGPTIELIDLPDDQIANALLPDFQRIVFGIHMVRNGMCEELVYGPPPHYSDWDDRVYMLTRLLLPYLNQDSQGGTTSPDGLPGQSPNTAASASAVMSQMNNPFISARHGHTRARSRSARRGAGRERPPFPAYDLQELDKYYSQQASEVVVKSQSGGENRRQPDNLEVGFLDSEPAPLSALVSGRIDWFRTRVVSEGERNKLKFFRHSDPLEMPLGGDSPSSSDLPHLLFLVDSSSSMGFNPTSPHPNSRGKYDLVLLSCYGILKYIEDMKLADRVQAACINFSGGCIESGWYPVSEINRSNDLHKFKQVLLTYQGGGTVLDPEGVRRVFSTRPGNFFGVVITDGEVGNAAVTAEELANVMKSGCDLVLLHVGKSTQFTEEMKMLGCPVQLLPTAEALVGLSLDMAKVRFQGS